MAGTIIVTAALLASLVLVGQRDAPPPIREILLPQELGIPAEMKWLRGHALIIHRSANRFPGVGDQSVSVMSRDGREVFQRAPGNDIPGAESILISSMTLAPNLTLTVSASLWDNNGRNVLVLVQYDLPSATLKRIIRTNPVWCSTISADSQNDLWCAGSNVEKRAARRTDFALLHKYASTGQLVSSFIPRTFYGDTPYPLLGTHAGGPDLVAHETGMSLILPAVFSFFSWDLDAPAPRQIQFPDASNGERYAQELTVLEDGRLIQMRVIADKTVPQRLWRRALFELRPGQTAWQRMGSVQDFAVPFHLIGAEGTSVVIWDKLKRALAWHTVSQ